jgi:hypothetical protein
VLFTKPDLFSHVWLRVNSINLIRCCYDATDAPAIVYLDGALAVIGSMIIPVVEELVDFGRSWASATPPVEKIVLANSPQEIGEVVVTLEREGSSWLLNIPLLSEAEPCWRGCGSNSNMHTRERGEKHGEKNEQSKWALSCFA